MMALDMAVVANNWLVTFLCKKNRAMCHQWPKQSQSLKCYSVQRSRYGLANEQKLLSQFS